jgi:polyketide biosynthesis enoyl-CoA hydratase PksI
MEPVEIERPEDGIAILRLNDPRHDNHLTEALCGSWIAALHRLAADSSLNVLLIRGLTKVFCAGASAEELKQITAGKVQVRDLELPDCLLQFPVPVIAAMEGHAAGGGFVAALCCDLLVAASDRRYGLNFTQLGFTPGMGVTRLLPALLGYHHAAEVLFSGRFFRGDELAARGLFNAAVPSPEVFPRALDLARQIAPKPRHVLEMTKAALCLPRRLSLAEALPQEHLMHRICFSTPCEPAAEAEKYFPAGAPRQ